MKYFLRKCAAAIAPVLIAVALGLYTTAHAQERSTAASSQSAVSGQVVLPSMPDGMYMTTYPGGAMPFLLVDKGQWVDPYMWVQRNGIEALNMRFVRGRRFEVFHMHSWRASIDSMVLHSMGPQQLLAHDQLKNYAKFDIKSLPPAISDQRCSFGGDGVHRWRCDSTTISTKFGHPMQSCSTSSTSMGCGTGVTASVAAYQELAKKKLALGFLKVDGDAISRQIDAEFKRVAPSVTARNRIRADVYPMDVFYGPSRQRLIAGFMDLKFRTNAKWKPRFSGEPEPASKIELGFIWDIDRARFAYLQDKPKVLDASLMRACEHTNLDACPRARSLGMWAIGDKLYVVWQYSQIIGMRAHKNPPSAGAYEYEPKDELAFPEVKQLVVMEIQLTDRVSKELFATTPFLSFSPY